MRAWTHGLGVAGRGGGRLRSSVTAQRLVQAEGVLCMPQVPGSPASCRQASCRQAAASFLARPSSCCTSCHGVGEPVAQGAAAAGQSSEGGGRAAEAAGWRSTHHGPGGAGRSAAWRRGWWSARGPCRAAGGPRTGKVCRFSERRGREETTPATAVAAQPQRVQGQAASTRWRLAVAPAQRAAAAAPGTPAPRPAPP